MSTNAVSEDTLLQAIMLNGLSVVEHSVVDSQTREQYTQRCVQEMLSYPELRTTDEIEWYMPSCYQTLDICKWCIDQCTTNESRARTEHELELFAQHNMIKVLQCIKYIVDTLREHNVVWGVGRGSSVASYVLYLIGIHRIDSIKYNLPIDEFFKEV